MADPYVRQDIWRLEEKDPFEPITLAYALAVREMQKRKDDDPTGWAYQAAVHACFAPAKVPVDQWRNQCQHHTWFFLPWHRMYLYWWERIVRSVIVTLPNVSAETKKIWALPYWDYDRAEETRALPPAFRAKTLPDGTSNPLFITQRDPLINSGGRMHPLTTSAQEAMTYTVFATDNDTGKPAGFGGLKTGWHHFSEVPGQEGQLESTPHDTVHVAVGGHGGYMSMLPTAPLDPIFWLHHANIDRLWQVWLRLGGRQNPSDPAWLEPKFAFHFHDETKKDVDQVPQDVIQTADQLGYRYESLPTEPVSASIEAMGDDKPHRAGPAELLGSTDAPLELAGTEVSVVVPLEGAATDRMLAESAAERPGRLYLNVGNIAGERNPGLSYAVYVHDREAAGEGEYVGNVTFFGIEETANLDRDHETGHGLRHAFDVTDAVARLGVESPDGLAVRFSPLTVEPPPGLEAAAAEAEGVPPVTIGSVSFFYG
jgi:hypothetical protein